MLFFQWQIQEASKLDNNLHSRETYINLKWRPKLKTFLNHCTKERHYSIFIKNMEISNRRLRRSLHAICSYIYGKETTEDNCYSRSTTSKSISHGIPFSPSKQHKRNPSFYLVCTEYDKPRIACSQRPVSAERIRAFKRVVWDLFHACGAVFEKLAGSRAIWRIVYSTKTTLLWSCRDIVL